jgi:hypothetical protein
MKVKTLINMLEAHNLDAEIIFRIEKESCILVNISSESDCRCKEKEIMMTISSKEIR